MLPKTLSGIFQGSAALDDTPPEGNPQCRCLPPSRTVHRPRPSRSRFCKSSPGGNHVHPGVNPLQLQMSYKKAYQGCTPFQVSVAVSVVGVLPGPARSLRYVVKQVGLLRVSAQRIRWALRGQAKLWWRAWRRAFQWQDSRRFQCQH